MHQGEGLNHCIIMLYDTRCQTEAKTMILCISSLVLHLRRQDTEDLKESIIIFLVLDRLFNYNMIYKDISAITSILHTILMNI